MANHIVKPVHTVLSTSDNRLSTLIWQNPDNPPEKSTDLETTLAFADRIISYWDSNPSKPMMMFQSNRKEAYEYLAAVDSLHSLMETLFVTHSSSANLVRAQLLMEMSRTRLVKEFHRILSANVKPTMEPDDFNSSDGSSEEDWSSGGSSRNLNSNADEICEIDMMPDDAVLDLRILTERMVSAGYGGDCVRIYRLTRKSVIEGCLNRIGAEGLSRSNVQKMQWEILDLKIKKWIRAVKIAVRIVFASEKRLCAEMFAGFNHIRDSCFSEVVKGQMMQLLDFGESVARSKKSTERLFTMLDMYETLSDLMPDIDTVFCQESCAAVRTQASTILVRLGELALGNLSELENAIEAEKSNAPIAGGTIHPLTRYVMNYLSFLSDYKEPLMNITANAPFDVPESQYDVLKGFYGDLDGHDDELGSPECSLSMKLGWIIIIMLCKLDLKAKLYHDVALSYLFLMNNLHYVVKKVKGSKLLGLLGYGWLRKNENKVRQFAANYERAAWMKVLDCLRDEELHVTGDISSGVSQQQALEEKFKGFNFAIEEALRKHSGWMVPDVEVREELKISIAEKMIPAYQSLSGSLKSYSETGRYSEVVIKHTPEDLEAHLSHLFYSNPSYTSSNKS